MATGWFHEWGETGLTGVRHVLGRMTRRRLLAVLLDVIIIVLAYDVILGFRFQRAVPDDFVLGSPRVLHFLVIAVVGVVSIYILQFAPEALAHERRYYTLCMTVVLVVMLVRLLEASPYYAIYALTSVSAMAIFLSALLSPQVAVGAVLLVSILIGAAANLSIREGRTVSIAALLQD